MKLDLNFMLNGIDGKPLEGVFENIHCGAVVGRMLCYIQKQFPEMSHMKRTVIGMALYKKEVVEIDEADLKAIKIIISSPEAGFSPIILYQLENELAKLETK